MPAKFNGLWNFLGNVVHWAYFWRWQTCWYELRILLQDLHAEI